MINLEKRIRTSSSLKDSKVPEDPYWKLRAETRLGMKENSAPIFVSGRLLEHRGYSATTSNPCIFGPHTPPRLPTVLYISGASISPTQCGFNRKGGS